jgi:ankyrin repeat protein
VKRTNGIGLCLVLPLVLAACSDRYSEKRFAYKAIPEGDIGFMQKCIDRGLNIHERSSPELTPYLILAARCGNPESARFLLEKGADPNNLFPDPPFVGAFTRGMQQVFLLEPELDSALRSAARYPEVVKILLDSGADPNALLAGGFSTLMAFINYLYNVNYKTYKPAILESMALLLDYGADPNYRDETVGISPLLLALNYNVREAVDLLLEYGVKPGERMVQITLPDPTNIRAVDAAWGISWQSELHGMVYNGYVDLVMPYFESGEINPYTKTPDGNDYFYFAVEGGSPEMLMALLPYNKNINERRYKTRLFKNLNLFHVAALNENLESVKVLLANGASTDDRVDGVNDIKSNVLMDGKYDILRTVTSFEEGRVTFPEYEL